VDYTLRQNQFYIVIVLCLVIAACSGPKELGTDNLNGFESSSAQASEILTSIPDYSTDLQTISGKGRAIVSEPGNTERVTVLFWSNRSKSLVTVRNGIGVEGGQLLTDGDTLLVYNKLDDFARKIPIRGGDLDRINRIASLNILDMINYTGAKNDVETVLENEDLYQLQLSTGIQIYVDKDSYLIRQVIQPQNSELPYSKITYDGYATIEGFKLPRRISIFGVEQKSNVALQLTTQELNPTLD
jgi:outer membrane lipoprotein-sorting protein